MKSETIKRVEYYENGSVKSEEYCINGNTHREDGPAFICYYQNGNTKREEYCINGNAHREDGPALIEYNKYGNVKIKQYYINNKLHREDGPAYIVYCDDGDVTLEEYYINGERHREDGPALIRYIYMIHNCDYGYWINNIEVTSAYNKYKNKLTKKMINAQKSIEKLLIMKLICKENNNDSELLDLIENKIITLQLSK